MTDLHFDLYTKPDCIQCAMTRRQLDRRGATYRELDAISNLDTLTAHGIQAAPGVLAYQGDTLIDAWGGFRPDRIKHTIALATIGDKTA